MKIYVKRKSLQKHDDIAGKALLRNLGTTSSQQTHCTRNEVPESNATLIQSNLHN
jgi:hypothetical protein